MLKNFVCLNQCGIPYSIKKVFKEQVHKPAPYPIGNQGILDNRTLSLPATMFVVCQGHACVYAKYAAAYFNFWTSKK